MINDESREALADDMVMVRPPRQTPQSVNAASGLHPISAVMALTNGALYFFVAAAGSENYQNVFDLEKDSPEMKALIYGLGLGSSLCYACFNYMMFENLTLKPKHPMSFIFAALAPISASSFLTAGQEGAKYMGIHSYVALGLGMSMYFFRMMALLDGDVKFPDRAKELKNQIQDSIAACDWKDMLRMAVTLYTALGFCISGSDAIYTAFNLFMKSAFDVQDEQRAIVITYSFIAVLGAMGFFPMAYYWTKRGINQLTFGGKTDANGVNPDPSDLHTIVGGMFALPVVAGCLGSVTQANGSVFGKLGMFATGVRLSSSALYAVAGGVPGLSNVSRKLTKAFCSGGTDIESGAPETQPFDNHVPTSAIEVPILR